MPRRRALDLERGDRSRRHAVAAVTQRARICNEQPPLALYT